MAEEKSSSGIGNLVILGLIIWAIASFSSGNSDKDSSPSTTSSSQSSYETAGNSQYNNDTSAEDDDQDLSDDTDDSSDDSDTFHGYDCTDDCSGHEAGYQWAEDKGLSSGDECDTPSNSFNEGCQAYIDEN